MTIRCFAKNDLYIHSPLMPSLSVFELYVTRIRLRFCIFSFLSTVVRGVHAIAWRWSAFIHCESYSSLCAMIGYPSDCWWNVSSFYSGLLSTDATNVFEHTSGETNVFFWSSGFQILPPVSLKRLIWTQIAGPFSQRFWFSGSGDGLRICISNKLAGDDDAGGPGDHTRTSHLGCITKPGIDRPGRSLQSYERFSKAARPRLFFRGGSSIAST